MVPSEFGPGKTPTCMLCLKYIDLRICVFLIDFKIFSSMQANRQIQQVVSSKNLFQLTQFLAYHTWNSQFYIIREVWVYVLQPFYLKFVEWVFLNLFIRRYLKALITSTIYVPMTYYKGKPFSSIPKSLNVLRKRMYVLQFHARRSICKLQTTDSNKDKRTFSSP